MPEIIPEIVDQHGEEAAFLWHLRDAAVSAPHYLLVDLARLDQRVDAHIDGLRVAGEPGWEIVKTALETGEPGAIFAGAVLAFEGGDEAKIQQIREVGTAMPETVRGPISALRWLPYDQAYRHIKTLLAAELPALKRVGIAASALHSRNPGPALQAAFASDDLPLKARALRALGELGLVDSHITPGPALKPSTRLAASGGHGRTPCSTATRMLSLISRTSPRQVNPSVNGPPRWPCDGWPRTTPRSGSSGWSRNWDRSDSH